MASNDDSNIIQQVDNRLDDLFGDEETQDPGDAPLRTEMPLAAVDASGEAAENPAAGHSSQSVSPLPEKNEAAPPEIDAEEIENSPIKDLKSIILSLEWEITDPVMGKLEEEIRKLEIIAQDDKIILAYLQLLGSLGKYIRNKLARAHVDSITLLHAVYESLEKAMLSKEMSDGAKKKMLIAHVTQYKKLKKEIQSGKKPRQRANPAGQRPPAPSAPNDPGAGHLPSATAREPKTDLKDISHVAQEILHCMRDIQKTIQQEFSALRGEIQRLREENK